MSARRSLIAVLPACLFAGSGCLVLEAPDEPEIATNSLEIVGGSPSPLDPSVIMLSTFGSCTGSLIAPNVVLTAAHCVSDPILSGNKSVGNVRFGSGGGSFTDQIGVADMAMHRFYDAPGFLEWDIALVKLDRDAPVEFPLLPYNTQPLNDDWIGTPLRTVGFGVTDGAEQTGFGTKRQVDLTLDEVTFFHIGLGSATRNICQGDSGGPTFAKIDGVETIMGVASFGSDDCRARSYISRTDVSIGFIEQIVDAWYGPCRRDGVCVTDGCRTPDPDCDWCGFDGFCATECEAPDFDCPLGKRPADLCSDRFDCESRLCLEAEDDPRISFCSHECDPSLPPRQACSTPLNTCVERDGQFVCAFFGASPSAQGSLCGSGAECRSGLCDGDEGICVEPCGEGMPACFEGFECAKVDDDLSVCTIPGEKGCSVGGADNTGSAALLLLLAFAWRRRPRSLRGGLDRSVAAA